MKIDSRSQLPRLMDFYNLPRIIAEVGTAEGIFAKEILGWGVQKLYLIDIWERVPFIPGCGSFPQEWHDGNYQKVFELFGDKENVTILKGFSYKVAEQIPNESLGMAYIDAGHDEYSVMGDIETFWKKLMPGGVMAFHDFANPEYQVWKAVKQFVNDNSLKINTLYEDGDVVNIGAWIRK